MKIAIIAHLKFPISEPYFGGLEAHTHVLVKGLMAAGHDVTLFASADSDPTFNLRIPPNNVIDQEQQPASDTATGRFVLEFIDLMHTYTSTMLELQAGNFDIVHNNSLHYVPLAMAGILSCPIVTVLHCPPFPSMASGIKLGARHANSHVVTVSENLGQNWREHLTNYRVIHNGIRVSSWTYNETPEPKTAIWFGRFCPEKGTHYAIQAARAAGYHLKLIGTVYDTDYFEQNITPLLGDDVEFCGHMDHAELSVAIGQASVGLFTSTWDEPFGLVLTEMLACGTPVVAFDSGAVAEILTPECGVIVPNHDAESMARAIPLATKLDRRACRRRAVEDFPVSRMVAKYEALYRELIAASQPAIALKHELHQPAKTLQMANT